jgi:hypothetical protein
MNYLFAPINFDPKHLEEGLRFLAIDCLNCSVIGLVIERDPDGIHTSEHLLGQVSSSRAFYNCNQFGQTMISFRGSV